MSNLTFDEAIENLQNEDANIRKEAIESLIGVNDEKAIDPLINATTDDNAQVRFKAAEILGNMGNLAFDRLADKFASAEGKNKRFLAFALKETGNERAIPLFRKSVSDEDFGVRKVSIRALGELQANDELDTIAEGLDDEDWGVRLAVIYACADLATDESIALIKKARRNESEKDFKKSCNKALKKAEKTQKARAEGKVTLSTLPMKTIKEMETINPQKAIKEYEKHVASSSDKDTPYKRLAVLYRKLNLRDRERRVIEKAIEVLSDKKPGKEKWFVDRLEKMK